MKKDFESQEFYFAETQEEKEKEQRNRTALHSIFPILMGGKEDKTHYVVRNEEKTPKSAGNINSTTNVQPASNLNPDAKKVATPFENPKNDFNFDPWQREKTLDRMREVKYPKLFGEMGTMILPRADYHSKEEFDYINTTKFNSIIDKNLEHEGGYVNDKNDRGGETNWGITKPFMEDFKYALPEGKAIPIKELTVDDAKKLYKALWDRYNLGYVRDKNVAYVIFDYMINTYHHTAAKRVQEILNSQDASLKVDGHIGNKSLNAINNCGYKWLIDEILKNRQYHHQQDVYQNPEQRKYYAGWMNRLNKIAEAVGSDIRFSTKF